MPQPGGYLLDTNIVVALVRNGALGQYLDGVYGLRSAKFLFAVSIITLGEVFALVGKFGWGAAKQASLHSALAAFATIAIDLPVVYAYAEFDAFTDSIGQPMGKNDLWIAATTRVCSLMLLTSDRDFDRLDPNWIDREWVDPASKLP